MKKLKVFLFIWIMTGVFVSCEKENIAPPTSQEILFECSYSNYAWGLVHQGFFIDNKGKIWTYSQYPDGGYLSDIGWNFPDSLNNISEQALMENLRKTTVRDTLIDQNTLKKYSNKIYLVKEDDYTENHGGCDGGVAVYACYRYDENTKNYHHVILSTTGDWIKINNDTNAKQISDWLQSIH